MSPKDQEKNQPAEPQNLLENNEFEDLMIAEYEASNHQVDELSKSKNWKSLETKIKTESRPSSKKSYSLFGSIALAAIALFIFIPKLMQDDPFSTMQIKSGKIQIETELKRYMSDGSQKEFTQNEAVVGDIATLQIKASQQGFVSLILIIDNHPPAVVIDNAVIHEGAAQLLYKESKIYGYQIEPGQKNLKFCTLNAPSVTLLKEMLAIVSKSKDLHHLNCHELKVKQ